METDRPLYYILDDNHQLVPCADVLQWEESFEPQRVSWTKISAHIEVSTVFTGIDKALEVEPAVFETMIFVDGKAHRSYLSCSWDNAQYIHHSVVATLREKGLEE